MVGGFVTFWVKLKDRVDGHSDMFIKLQRDVTTGILRQEDKIDDLGKVIDDMKTMGSPASRQSVIVMNARIDSQNQRLIRVEDAVIAFKEIQTDVGWIKKMIQKDTQI